MTPFVFAIDPGYTQSAYVVLTRERSLVDFAIHPNGEFLDYMQHHTAPHCVIERVAGYGMPVGAEVFETVYFSGQLAERWRSFGRGEADRLFRRDVKLEICKSPKANDASIRQALLDMYGPGREVAIGTKKAPGPLFGVSKDVWAALALGVTWLARAQAATCSR